MTTVKQVFTGDASQLQREFEKMVKSVATLEGKLGQATAKSEGLAQKEKSALSGVQATAKGAIGQVQQLALSYVSYEAAISAVNTALEIQNRLQNAALERQTGLAAAQASLAFNVLDEKQLKERVVPEVERISKDTGFADLDKLTIAAGAAISAAGGKIELALEGLRTSAGLNYLTPDTLQPMAEAGIDVARTANVSTDEGLALAMTAGQYGRVADPQQQSRLMSKSIGAIVASSRGDRKDAAEQAAELVAAMTLNMGDPTGEQSRTASIQLSSKLNEFFEKGFKETDAYGRTRNVKPGIEDPGGVVERIIALQKNPEMAKRFTEGASFEAAAKPIIERMLKEPMGQEAKTLEQARPVVGYRKEVLDEARKSIQGATPQLEVANEDVKRRAREESRQLDDPRALIAEAKKIRDEELFAYQEYSVRDSASQFAENKLQDFFQYDPISTTKREVEQRLQGVYKAPSLFGTSRTKTDEELTVKESKDRDRLKEILDQLIRLEQKRDAAIRDGNQNNEQIKAIREQTEVIKQQTEVIKQNQQPAPLIPTAAARGMIGAGRER